jgi:hypothetical protein
MALFFLFNIINYFNNNILNPDIIKNPDKAVYGNIE